MSLFGRKAGGFTPLDPPSEVVRQLEEIDKARGQAAQMMGQPRQSAGAIPNSAEMEMLRARQQMEQQAQLGQPNRELASAMRDQTSAMDSLNKNICQLCNLLETLQLSVIERK